MSSAARDYTSEVTRRIGYMGAWLPDAPIHVGDIGTPDEYNVFVAMSSLEHLGIAFRVELSDAPKEHADRGIGFTSEGGVDTSLKLAGSSTVLIPHVPLHKAGVGFHFNRAHAVVFRADGLQHARLADEIRLLGDIRALVDTGNWDPKWTIVTQVVHAQSTTVVVAGSSDAAAEVSLEGGVGAGALELLSAGAGAQWAHRHHLAVDFLGRANLTPLFRAKRLKKRLFRKEVLRPAYGDLGQDEIVEVEETEETDDDIFEDTPVYGGTDGHVRVEPARRAGDPWGDR